MYKRQVGNKVILDSGIHGVIRAIHSASYEIEIAPGVLVECEKYGVIYLQGESAQPVSEGTVR